MTGPVEHRPVHGSRRRPRFARSSQGLVYVTAHNDPKHPGTARAVIADGPLTGALTRVPHHQLVYEPGYDIPTDITVQRRPRTVKAIHLRVGDVIVITEAGGARTVRQITTGERTVRVRAGTQGRRFMFCVDDNILVIGSRPDVTPFPEHGQPAPAGNPARRVPVVPRAGHVPGSGATTRTRDGLFSRATGTR